MGRSPPRMWGWPCLLLVGVAYSFFVGALQAQGQEFDVFAPLASGKSASAQPTIPVRLTTNVTGLEPGKPFWVGVYFDVPPNLHTYYQSSGGTGIPTKVGFSAPNGFKVGAVLFPVPSVDYKEIGADLNVSYVYRKPTLIYAEVTAPNTFAGERVQITADVSFQTCSDTTCWPSTKKTLKLDLPVLSAGKATESADDALFNTARKRSVQAIGKGRFVEVTPVFSQSAGRAKDNLSFALVVKVAPGHHIQMNRPTVEGLISTDVVLHHQKSEPWNPGAIVYPKGDPAPEPPGLREIRGEQAILVPLTIKDEIGANGSINITGVLICQTCKDGGSCYPAESIGFAATLPLAGPGVEVKPTSSPWFTSSSAEEAPKPPKGTTPNPREDPKRSEQKDGFDLAAVAPVVSGAGPGNSTLWFFFAAFLGGLILNVMPCVLPVLAIKAVSFVEQAGESRKQILLLNLAYAGGVVAFFLVLATLAVVVGIGWGGLFQLAGFNIILALVVFVFAVNLMGVYEISLPGFVGGAASHREGLAGAFVTGVFATVLATPCSGPFLGPTLTWSLQQPVPITYGVWTMMGLGLASPYLLFGMFPGTVRWIPRPGDWMVRFKQFAGIILLATDVFILSFLGDDYVIPMLTAFVGIAIALWMIGNLYNIVSPEPTKWTVRILAGAICASTLAFAGGPLLHWMRERREFDVMAQKAKWLETLGPNAVVDATAEAKAEKSTAVRLPWQPFSEKKLKEQIAAGKTVLVEFSAKWCLTCKVKAATALNTTKTLEAVDELGVVTLYADYTDYDPEVLRYLETLGGPGQGVPLSAIFPANRPNQPIVLKDVFTQAHLLEMLNHAGASKGQAPRRANEATSAARTTPTAR